MSCEAQKIQICGRHNDFLNNYLFTYSEEISDCHFFIDIKTKGIERVVKSYSIGNGLSFHSPTQLMWDFGKLLKIPAGEYTFALKIVIAGKPSTDLVGDFIVKKELTKWKS